MAGGRWRWGASGSERTVSPEDHVSWRKFILHGDVCVFSEADGIQVCERQRMGMCRRKCREHGGVRRWQMTTKTVKDL